MHGKLERKGRCARVRDEAEMPRRYRGDGERCIPTCRRKTFEKVERKHLKQKLGMSWQQ